jgi:hypothetical protein
MYKIILLTIILGKGNLGHRIGVAFPEKLDKIQNFTSI